MLCGLLFNCGAVNGFIGSVYATLFMWIRVDTFSLGVAYDLPPWMVALGVANNVFFILFMLLLNFDSPLHLIGLIGLVAFIGLWMMFLDPGNDAFDNGCMLSLSGTTVAGFIVAVVGITRAVIVCMLPYPYWALEKAQDSARGIAKELCETLVAVIAFIAFYCTYVAKPYEISHVLQNLHELAGVVDRLVGHVTYGWWECFQMGYWQKARVMLNFHNRTSNCGAVNGIIGSFYVTLFMWIQVGIFSLGVAYDLPTWMVALGVANNVLFILFMLLLNFDSPLHLIGLDIFVGL